MFDLIEGLAGLVGLVLQILAALSDLIDLTGWLAGAVGDVLTWLERRLANRRKNDPAA